MQLTSQVYSNAISFARSLPGLAGELQRRDNNPALYASGIICRMQVYSNDPDHFYIRIIFDYSLFDERAAKGPDLFIDLTTLKNGGFRVLEEPKRFVGDAGSDSQFKKD